ncbi:hypothetical protein AMTR_s00110p00087790 [Amborella trichopoda]|uniref:Uncharacterized protein n=1 Tax=Amborella trichopoda TaxID=13333 RepID=W1NZ04_AMBTC|nr:hypothetical protein AMTR_s00110p00087790 [Amborella trichopoda]
MTKLSISGGSYRSNNGFLQTFCGSSPSASKTGTTWLSVLLFSIASHGLIPKAEAHKLILSTYPHKLIPQVYLVRHGLIPKEERTSLSSFASGDSAHLILPLPM